MEKSLRLCFKKFLNFVRKPVTWFWTPLQVPELLVQLRIR